MSAKNARMIAIAVAPPNNCRLGMVANKKTLNASDSTMDVVKSACPVVSSVIAVWRPPSPTIRR